MVKNMMVQYQNTAYVKKITCSSEHTQMEHDSLMVTIYSVFTKY